MIEQILEIDCPPGQPRPGDLLPHVLEGTGIEVRDTNIRFFGCWTWDYSDIDSEVWKAAQPVIAERLKQYHAKGIIRYGSW